MLFGSNVGAYAALNMLIEFDPPKVTDTHDGVLKPHVVNAYASKRRAPGPPAAEIGGGGFCALQTLAVSCRFSRKFCTPVDPTTPVADAGEEPSRFLVTLKVVTPIGTENACDSGPPPPV